MSYAIGCKCGLDLALLWLWCRLASAGLIPPLTWELPHATGVALKSKKKKKKKEDTVCMGPEGTMLGLRGF